MAKEMAFAIIGGNENIAEPTEINYKKRYGCGVRSTLLNIRFFIRPVFYGIFLFSLFLYACTSARRIIPSTLDFAKDVAGDYYGSGKLWSPGDIEDVAITLTYVDNETVNATILSVLPSALQALGGKKTMTGKLTVSPEYTLTGKIKLMIFNFAATGSVDPATHTIQLLIPGNVMGHPLNFELTGQSGEPVSAKPDFAAEAAGSYFGTGTMAGEQAGDITEAEIHMAQVNNTTVAVLLDVVFPAELEQVGGLQTMRGNLTVSPDYEITGTVKLMRTYDLAVAGSIDLANHTITLNLSGIVEGNTLNLILNLIRPPV